MEKNKHCCIADHFFFIALLLYLPIASSSQPTTPYPLNYFKWPLSIKPEIVANMGELRPNHWHMGLDIRTNQKENIPVQSAAAGYIARIRIEKSGFGRCIFINHPNGLTTLYAHLNNFFPELERYVTEQQYSQEKWSLDLVIPKEKFPVTQGQFIAYSGNTGGSQGPHVHFEIRDTKTEECLNPLQFGFDLPDQTPPVMLKLAMYDRSSSIYETTARYLLLRATDSGYIIPKLPVVSTGSNQISFGLQAFDRLTGSSNEDGIYSAQLFFDGQPVILFRLDSISYRETRYMNAHTDFKYRHNGGPFFQHIFQLPGDRGGVYQQLTGNGLIHLYDTANHSVRLEVKDANQNMSHLNFIVRYDEGLANMERQAPSAIQLLPNQVNVFSKPGFEARISSTSLYDTLSSFYFRNNTISSNAVTVSHQLNDPSVPLHDDITIRIRPEQSVPDAWKDKIVMQRSYRKSRNAVKAVWDGEWLTAKFGDFGNFQAFVDLELPQLNELGKGDTVNLSSAQRIIFQPRDNFGIKSFRAELDSQWLRFTNDKGYSHIYIFDERCPYGIHQLKVTVEDLAGNITTKSWWFKKYPYTPPPRKKLSKKKSKAKNAKPGKKTKMPAKKKPVKKS